MVKRPRGKKNVGQRVTWWEMVTEFVPGTKQVSWRGRSQKKGVIAGFWGSGLFSVKEKGGKKTNVKRDFLTLREDD